MSDTYFNIRFGTYNFQIHSTRPYFTFRQNPRQVSDREFEPNWKWFTIYQAFGKHFF